MKQQVSFRELIWKEQQHNFKWNRVWAGKHRMEKNYQGSGSSSGKLLAFLVRRQNSFLLTDSYMDLVMLRDSKSL